MKCLKRNKVPFTYYAYEGQAEEMSDGRHTGRIRPVYGSGTAYHGNISAESGVARHQLFGTETPYTHTLVMEDPDAPIDEYGYIGYLGSEYEVISVSRSLNVFRARLRKRTAHVQEYDGGQGT